MARAFLFFVDLEVQSLDHTHVGSSPIVGPVLGQISNFFLFSVSDRIYGMFFSRSAPRFALWHRTPLLFRVQDVHRRGVSYVKGTVAICSQAYLNQMNIFLWRASH
jgi:hypothetical protein